MGRFWMVRAGEGGYLVNDFEKSGTVGIGWDGDFTLIRTPDEMRSHLRNLYPDYTPAALGNAAAMAFKFREVMKPGDFVVTYDPQRREYLEQSRIVVNVVVFGYFQHDTLQIHDLQKLLQTLIEYGLR